MISRAKQFSGKESAYCKIIFASNLQKILPYLICNFIVSLCKRIQPHSSLMSGHCSTPSHTCVFRTQPPALQWNWSNEQSADRESIFNLYFIVFSTAVILHWSAWTVFKLMGWVDTDRSEQEFRPKSELTQSEEGKHETQLSLYFGSLIW